MSVTNKIMKQTLLKLVMQHLPNKVLNKLLLKAPRKQGAIVIPDNGNSIIRRNSISTLTNIRNLDYTIAFLEDCKSNIEIMEKYTLGGDLVDFKKIKEEMHENKGEQLGYLLFVIERFGVEQLSDIFENNTERVEEFANFLKELGLENYIIDTNKEENKTLDLENKYNQLRNQLEQTRTKYHTRIVKLKKELHKSLEKINDQKNVNEIQSQEIDKLKIELINKEKVVEKSNNQFETLKNQNKVIINKNKTLQEKNDELVANNRKTILVIGNLPNESILDNIKFRIIVIPSVASFKKNVDNYQIIKVYVQAEYVSINTYAKLKNKFSEISFEYISRENMKRG